MNHTFTTLLAVSVLAVPTLAQGVITNQNVTYELYALPDSTDVGGPRIRFNADSNATSTVAFSFWWHYRLGGDAREFTFNTSGGQLVEETYAGNGVATLRWDDFDGRGMSATYTITARAQSPSGGATVHQMTVRNDTAGPLDLDLFAYCDIDHCGSANNDTATGTVDRHTVTDASCPVTAEFYGHGATGYVADFYPNVINALIDGAVDDLPNTGLPFATPADYTGAMQFTSPVLQPGESFTAVAVLSHDFAFTACPSAPTTRNYGVAVAGALGAPTIETLTPAVMGGNGRMRIANAAPGASGTLLFGANQLNGDLGIPLFGLTLYVSTNAVSVAYDGNGELTLQLNIPHDPAVCGVIFHWQALVTDATSVAGLPVTHTDALEWTIGT